MIKNPRFTAKGAGPISGWGTKILHVMQRGQKKKKTIFCHLLGSNALNRGRAIFSIKGQILNVLDFVGHTKVLPQLFNSVT